MEHPSLVSFDSSGAQAYWHANSFEIYRFLFFATLVSFVVLCACNTCIFLRLRKLNTVNFDGNVLLPSNVAQVRHSLASASDSRGVLSVLINRSNAPQRTV
jgi:hypothetical protein